MYKIARLIAVGLKHVIYLAFVLLSACVSQSPFRGQQPLPVPNERPSLGLSVTYYVAINGSDSYNGLFPSYQSGYDGPFRTINRATGVVKPGDTVEIRAGTYQETVRCSANGTAANRITIANYQDETVIVDGGYKLPGGSVYDFLVLIFGDYVTFRDIAVKRSSGGLLALSGDYSYAINVIGNGSRETGLFAKGSHNLIDGCSMTDNGNGYGIGGQTTWGSAICTIGGNTTIQNCIAYENRGEGFNAYGGSTNSIFQDNVAYDNRSTNLYLDSSHNSTVQRNLVYQTKPEYLMNGIAIGAETGMPSDILICNNLVTACRVNFEIDSNVSSLSNVTVAYNTFVNSVGGESGYTMGVFYRADIDAYSNSIFKNNIIIEDDAGRVPIFVESPHLGLAFSNNCWNKRPMAAAQGPGDIIADPKLAKTGPTGPGLLTSAWFKILRSSPVRNRAQVLREVVEDFLKTRRDRTPDMGAFEISGIALPVTAQQQPPRLRGRLLLPVIFTGRARGATAHYPYAWTFPPALRS